MGSLSTAGRARTDRAGFTLVEILVVLIVLSLAAGAVVARIERDPARVLRDEARRLGGALEHAAARAQWTGEVLGFSLDGTHYRFWHRDASGRWNAHTGSDVLAPRALPAGIRVLPGTYAGAPLPGDAIVPFRASGHNEPFSVVIATDGASLLLTADPLNRIVLTGPDHAR